MEKIKFVHKFVILTILLLVLPASTRAFLDEDLGLNLYKNIDEGLDGLEIKLFQKEIRGNEESFNIGEQLNKFAIDFYGLEPCFKTDIDIEEYRYIEIGETFSDFLDDSCKGDENNQKISVEALTKYQQALNQFIKNAKITSEKKSKTIHSISRIGLYTDGDENNSPFDIIVDLQQIDKIIFGEELEYNGEDIGFLSDFKKDVFYKPKNSFKQSQTTESGSEIIDFINNTDLSEQEIEKIQNELSNTQKGQSSKLPNTNKIDTPDFIGSKNFSGTAYVSVNDNSEWPCQGFFCINVNFSTYNHKVLGYGKTKSIESVITKSNEHLKKGANTSLQQSKMTINNFEISLRDLNFPDQFHMGFVVLKKPVPILDLDNAIKKDNENGKKISGELSKKLKFYYKNLGLDYNRANDISIFEKQDAKTKNLIDTAELNPAFLKARNDELRKIDRIKAKLNNYKSSSLDKKLSKDILTEFYKEFIELERFVDAIGDYVTSLSGLIKKLREIPIYK